MCLNTCWALLGYYYRGVTCLGRIMTGNESWVYALKWPNKMWCLLHHWSQKYFKYYHQLEKSCSLSSGTWIALQWRDFLQKVSTINNETYLKFFLNDRDCIPRTSVSSITTHICIALRWWQFQHYKTVHGSLPHQLYFLDHTASNSYVFEALNAEVIAQWKPFLY